MTTYSFFRIRHSRADLRDLSCRDSAEPTSPCVLLSAPESTAIIDEIPTFAPPLAPVEAFGWLRAEDADKVGGCGSGDDDDDDDDDADEDDVVEEEDDEEDEDEHKEAVAFSDFSCDRRYGGFPPLAAAATAALM